MIALLSKVELDKLISGIAPKYLGPGIELDDLKQEALLAVVLSENKYTSEKGEPAGFLGNEIKNALKKFRRKNLSSTRSLSEVVADDCGSPIRLVDTIGEPPIQELAAQASQTLRRLDQRLEARVALANSQPKYKKQAAAREIMQLRAQGLTFAKIGERLGKSRKAVEMAYRRATGDA